jgi:hypothetical protein
MPSTSLPPSIRDLFINTHDGCPAVVVENLAEAANLELVLKGYGASFRTKIRQSKVHGRVFTIFLLTPLVPPNS